MPSLMRYEHTHVATTPDVWCPICASPTAYTSHVVITPRSNPTWIAARIDITRCDQCGTREATPIQVT